MHGVLLDKHRGWKVLLALLLASAVGCQSDEPARDDQRTVGPPLLDTPWTPPNTHHDEPFIQEVGTVVGNLTDVRSIALSPDGTCFVATPDGILQSSGADWKSLAIDASVSSLAISFDATGVMATGGPQGATLDGTTMPLPSSTQVAFIAPRTQGGWWLAGPSIAGTYDGDGGGSGDGTFHPLDALGNARGSVTSDSKRKRTASQVDVDLESVSVPGDLDRLTDRLDHLAPPGLTFQRARILGPRNPPWENPRDGCATTST